MNDQPTATLVGDPVDSPIAKPKTRADRVDAYRKEHEAEYRQACRDAQCTCTPTRAQMLIMNNYERPPID